MIFSKKFMPAFQSHSPPKPLLLHSAANFLHSIAQITSSCRPSLHSPAQNSLIHPLPLHPSGPKLPHPTDSPPCRYLPAQSCLEHRCVTGRSGPVPRPPSPEMAPALLSSQLIIRALIIETKPIVSKTQPAFKR